MFHLLLALPVFAVFGTMAGVVLMLILGLLGAVFVFEVVLGLFFQTARWLMWLPGLVCGIGLLLCFLSSSIVPLSLIVGFWIVFSLLAVCGRLVAAVLRLLFAPFFHH